MASGHSHGHGHGHGHGRDRVAADLRIPPALKSGAASGKIVYLDAPSGIAGDMTVAALLDLGVPADVVDAAIAALAIDGVVCRSEGTNISGIVARRFIVEETQRQAQRSYRDIRALIERADLRDGAARHAQAIFERLAAAEAQVHGVSIEDVHFHEVGAVDSIVDIVAAAACLAHLEGRLLVSPLPLGRGFVRCQHGRIPLPAPATILCLGGLETYDGGVDGELITPTGAAIAGALGRTGRWPRGVPLAVGYGAGTRTWPDRPNVLRAVLVQPSADAQVHAVHIEVTVDDMTGELAAHVIEQCVGAGALDAWATPVIMKKGRPGLVLSVLCEPARREDLAQLLLNETTSIGLRYRDVSRTVRPRRMHTVTTCYGDVPVKISTGAGAAPTVKPEFDVCARLAASAAVPVRVVIAAAVRAAVDSDPSPDAQD